jgi:hypothetical protein
MTVTAVIEDLPSNTHLDIKCSAPLTPLLARRQQDRRSRSSARSVGARRLMDC